MSAFACDVIRWQRRYGRRGLPWQGTRDAYRIWISEIMLQQTQVTTVIPYFERFVARFPDVAALAAADADEVLAHWSGLGYYSRARNLHRAAALVCERHGGRFPADFASIAALPGIGRSTAAAIVVFAHGARYAILDGNVKRVLARACGIEGYPGATSTAKALWAAAERLLPRSDIESYTQGLMDLGATVCLRRRPRCEACPVSAGCVARRDGRIDELPAPRPRKALPHRDTVMLVLERTGELLLEKRPPAGIWGGLWCFPEATLGQDAQSLCLERYGARVSPGALLPRVDHGFTHFTLSISPQWLRVTGVSPRAGETTWRWMPIAEIDKAAIPAPVRRIVDAMRTHARAADRWRG